MAPHPSLPIRPSRMHRRLPPGWLGLSLITAMGAPGVAWAQTTPADAEALAARVARLEAIVADQQQRIEAQDALLAQVRPVQKSWQVATPDEAFVTATLQDLRAGQVAGQAPAQTPGRSDPPQSIPAPSGAPPAQPPQLDARREQLAAIPEGIAVLSRPGRLSLDLSGEYTRSSANRLVFRGIEIVPGVQIGVIEANEADRDTLATTATARYGVTSRLEVEVRAPYVWRNDTITTVQQRDEAVTRTIDLKGHGVGDVEAAARYQINGGQGGWPIFVAGLKIKSDTGEGPFDIPRDEFGVATRLATGSGFWGVEPSVSFLYPSDPAVIFGSLSYFAHLARDIDQQEGEILIGRVDPGDAIGASIGFGFSLNPRFSFSLGYKHSYIFPTSTQLNDITEDSDELQVGALLFGLSYLLNDRFSLNGNFEFGVTEDAPDMRFVLRVPVTF